MLRKDVRSLTLCLVLGDGCLYTMKRKKKLYGGLAIDHGIKQADYQKWKAELLSKLYKRDVKVRTGHKGKSIQIAICDKRFRAWRKFCYENGKKSLGQILRFIRHPEMAIACLLMDDGYVEPSLDKRYPDKVYSAAFRIFTNDQSKESLDQFQAWLRTNFGVESKIRFVKNTTGKIEPFVKINCQNALKLWHKIREFILQFKSMKYKFRYIEHIYQLRVIQRVPGNYQVPDDIVKSISNDDNSS